MNDAPAPYVWLAPHPHQGRAVERAMAPARPRPDEDARVRAWARSRGASLSLPEASPSLGPPDMAVGDAVETELGRARDALAALDVNAVEGALGRAEALLRSHPELPQASWLRAEVERSWANRFVRGEPRDEARAARAWRRAASLDGGRVPGIGEASGSAFEAVTVSLRYTPMPLLEIHIDGRPALPGAIELGEGEHQVVARRDGEIVWASWIGVAKGTVIHLPSLASPPCSEGDLETVRRNADGALSLASVTCGRWFLVTGGEQIAQCAGPRCGPAIPLALALADEPRAPGILDEDRGRPHEDSQTRPAPWITWTAIGLGVLLTSGSLVYASGVFDKPDRESRWVAGGLRTE